MPKKRRGSSIMTSVLGVALLGLALLASTTMSRPMSGEDGTSSHVDFTREALMQEVTEACRAVAEAAGLEFQPTSSSPDELVQACMGPQVRGLVSGATFHSALQDMCLQNALVDRDLACSEPHHFHSEAFVEGCDLILQGMAAIKANVRNEDFQATRETLDRVLHTLQDFYSHSNWVELGNKEPYITLIRPDLPLENLADRNTPTCRDCETEPCNNAILPEILKEKKLTSGYMGLFSSAKPPGEGSHGGASDQTSTAVPRNDINKDEGHFENVAVHKTAVYAATTASVQPLEEIRLAAGDNDFLRMMGIDRSSAVCFVIDTSSSMSDAMAEVKATVHQLIESKTGTQDEPAEYILVPFNDPNFGPAIRTSDPDEMKEEISKLNPNGGGGDIPEMNLSGLQLALTTAPPSSHIYVFTDAEAKDTELKDTVMETKSTASPILIRHGPVSRRGRRPSPTAAGIDDYPDKLAFE